MLITAGFCRNNEFDICHDEYRLEALFSRDRTLVEVLTLAEGAWSDVTATVRIWVVLRPWVLTYPQASEFLARLVERALGRIENPDPRALAVISAIRRGVVADPAVYAEVHAALCSVQLDPVEDWLSSALYAAVMHENPKKKTRIWDDPAARPAAKMVAVWSAYHAAELAVRSRWRPQVLYASADMACVAAADAAVTAAATSFDYGISERHRQIDDLLEIIGATRKDGP